MRRFAPTSTPTEVLQRFARFLRFRAPMKRLPNALLLLLGTSLLSLAGCANGGSDSDDDAVDARPFDAFAPDGSLPDGASPDASSPDASSPDAAIDAVPLTGETCQTADL